MFDIDTSWYLIQFPSHCIGLDLLPVGLVVSLYWLSTKLPWPIQSRLLLHAVSMGAIIDSDHLEVSLAAVFLQSSHCDTWLLEVQKELNVWGAFRTLLQLSNHIDNILDFGPMF